MKRDIKRDIKTGIWLLCGLMAVAATGCVREETENDTRDTALLTVVGRAFGTRAAASDADGSTSFTDGDALSLFMRGTTYADVDNRRVSYTATGSTGTWKIAGKEILLNDRTAVASLVFPYSEAAAYDHIALAPGPYDVDKNDVVWKQQQVYASVHEAKVTDMKHALTRVKIILKRDDPADVAIPDRYTGAGSVTSVSLNNGSAAGTGVNAAVFTAGKLDLSSAQPASLVTGVTAGVVEDKTPFTLSTIGHTTDLLTLPVAAMASNLVMLNIVVDGKTMTQSFPYAAPAEKWEAGTCYVYTVTVKNAEVTFDKVVTTDWVTGEAIDGELDVHPVVGAYKDGGIVFWVDPDDVTHYKVVSPDERTLTWSEADAWTTAYGAGWYLPTENELTELYNARNSSGGIGTSYIDRGIAGNGGIAFGDGEYWSTTINNDNTSIRSVNLSNGNSGSHPKTDNYGVRAVKEMIVDYTTRPANCYITQPGIVFRFDATKKPRTFNGNAGSNPSTADAALSNDLLVSDIDKIEVVWQTAANHSSPADGTTADMIIQNISYDPVTGFCIVTPHTTGSGNALIAAYKGTTILWNWHIWVTEGKVLANVNTGDMTLNGGGKFMDRNLGALAAITMQPTEAEAYKYFGVVYQYGRPTPFTGQGIGTTSDTYTNIYNGSGTQITSSIGGFTPSGGAVANITVAIQNPKVYNYQAFSGYYTWTKINPSLWSDSPANKSIYDPCPYGYRVPINGSWKGLTVSHTGNVATINLGSVWNGTWWPMAGRRYDNGGNFNDAGSTANYWSSVSNTTYLSYRLYFNVSGSENYPSYKSNCGNGMSVRCVQDK